MEATQPSLLRDVLAQPQEPPSCGSKAVPNARQLHWHTACTHQTQPRLELLLCMLQEALMMDGPYAWAYDASGISIGSCTPSFSGRAGQQQGCNKPAHIVWCVSRMPILQTNAPPNLCTAPNPCAATGVQAYCHPHTGVLVAVEADVLLDTSAAAPGSVDLQVHARGPIGKFCFSLESARVRGMRVCVCCWAGGACTAMLVCTMYTG